MSGREEETGVGREGTVSRWPSLGLTSACKRLERAYAHASLRLFPAPDAWRSASMERLAYDRHEEMIMWWSTVWCLVTLILNMLVAPLAAAAQPSATVPRIGWLGGGTASIRPYLRDAFRQGLRERGWVEGQNIAIEYRWGEGKVDRLPALAAELVQLKVDVILAGSPLTAQAAQHATTEIPIVMAGVGDAVGLRLVTSLARPGGNLTG